MRTRLRIAAAFSLAGVSPLAAQDSWPWHVQRTSVVGRAEAIGGIASAALASDGSVLVLDYTTSTIYKYDPDGQLLWRAGRKGSGPGEFVQAYRVGPRPGGGAIVYDAATTAVTTFDASGKFERRYLLNNPRFAQADDIVQLSTGEVVIVGTARITAGMLDSLPVRARSSIHVYSPELQHARSFGPLPGAQNREVLRFWGAGFLSVTDNGDLLFSRKIPYEIYRYSPAGILRQTIRVDKALSARPDDFVSITPSPTDPTAREYRVTSRDVPRPARAFVLHDNLLVAGLLSERARTIDVIDGTTGRVVASRPMDRGWQTLIGFDRERAVLWVVAEVDDEAVLLRQELRLTP